MPSTSAEITFPRAERDKLILLASFNLSPYALVLDYLSDPAKSTKFNFPAVIFGSRLSYVFSAASIYIVKMQWDLDDSLFIAVSLTLLLLFPKFIAFSNSSILLTLSIITSLIKIPRSGDSFNSNFYLTSLLSKSYISSVYISINDTRTKYFF